MDSLSLIPFIYFWFFRMTSKWRNYLFAKEKHHLALIIKEKTDELVREKNVQRNC